MISDADNVARPSPITSRPFTPTAPPPQLARTVKALPYRTQLLHRAEYIKLVDVALQTCAALVMIKGLRDPDVTRKICLLPNPDDPKRK